MKNTQQFIKDNKERFLSELIDLLKIPSVSADPKHKQDLVHTAEEVIDRLLEAGVDVAEKYETPGHPIVYAEKIFNPALPTVLVYGHYDVQPADPLGLWDSPPFDPVIKKTKIHPEGAIFARGSCDDKGQMFMHVKAFEAMMAADELPCNVKFLIEGEEEVGSDNLGDFLLEHKELLSCDVVLISDTSIIANDVPSITVGLRGLSYVEVEVTGPNKDLHSGVYGGGVGNPVNILCEMIAAMKDEEKRITIPGFYDDVVVVSQAERDAMNQAPFDLKEYKADLAVDDVIGESGYTTLERTSIRPTLDVNGIWGGYIGEGAKTVLPSKAYAKISMRLVPNQDSNKITQLFSDYFESIAPPSVKVVVRPHHGGKPAVTPTNTPEYKAAALAMIDTFGKEPIPVRGGGSIPIVALFENVLNVKTVLMGFGLDSDDIHSPNEHFGLFNFYKGIETIPYFFQHYAQLKK
jgi:acetylornithine deacetylase/succinyl-diaminopimelate desuccinylase-like protein